MLIYKYKVFRSVLRSVYVLPLGIVVDFFNTELSIFVKTIRWFWQFQAFMIVLQPLILRSLMPVVNMTGSGSEYDNE